MTVKTCTKCGGTGPFAKDKRLPSGLTGQCRDCIYKYRHNWAASHATDQTHTPVACSKCGGPGPFYRDKAQKSGFTTRCKSCVDERVKVHRGAHKKERNRRVQAKRYGVQPETVDALFASQNGRCGICLESLKPGRETHLDHNHETGQVRGLLCQNCNRGLGLFKENPERLQSAVRWVRHFEGASDRCNPSA